MLVSPVCDRRFLLKHRYIMPVYFRKAYKLCPKCPVIASRCANGMMKIQQAYQNIKLAKEIITNLLEEHNNNAYVHIVAAFYFLRFGKVSSAFRRVRVIRR